VKTKANNKIEASNSPFANPFKHPMMQQSTNVSKSTVHHKTSNDASIHKCIQVYYTPQNIQWCINPQMQFNFANNPLTSKHHLHLHVKMRHYDEKSRDDNLYG
jgi:hypothetical protein